MKTSRALLSFLSFGVAGYAAFAYSLLPLGTTAHPDMKANFLTHSTAIYIHAFASIVALVVGPLQFSARLRQRNAGLHHWLGRAYLAVGVLVGGIAGLFLARYASGGLIARIGFSVLATTWLYTGVRAYLAVRRGALHEHQKWMVRNFSLTFAAVTLRIYLPLSMAAGIGFTIAYPIIAWLCWLPNLLFAEWRFNRSIALPSSVGTRLHDPAHDDSNRC